MAIFTLNKEDTRWVCQVVQDAAKAYVCENTVHARIVPLCKRSWRINQT